MLRVLAKRKEVSVHPYSQAFLRCSVISPSFLKRATNPFWTKDNKGSLDPQRYQQDYFLPKEGPDSTIILPFQLTIFNVTLKDYGGYSCGAEIKIGRSVIHLFQNLTILMAKIKEGKGQETFITIKTIHIAKRSDQVSYDHRRGERNLSNCVWKPEKVMTSTRFEAVTSR